MKRIITTGRAPRAMGPYSQAVEANGTLYIAGQVPLDPETLTIVGDNIKAQTLQALKNIGAILEEAGYTYSDVVKSTCYLADMKYFKEMNEVYGQFYPENPPARVAFAVKELPLGALVEIDAIAVRKP